jgi:hypothetical protein
MDDWNPGLTARLEYVPAERAQRSAQAQRSADDVNEAFERIRAQILACWGPEPMARVAT